MLTKKKSTTILAYLLALMCVGYIISILMRPPGSIAQVKIQEDWVIFQNEILKIDNVLLLKDQYKESSGKLNQLIAKSNKGAYVVQNGWMLTLYFQPRVNTLLGSNESLHISAVPIKVNNKTKWICINKETSEISNLPLDTYFKVSNTNKKLLPWKCQ